MRLYINVGVFCCWLGSEKRERELYKHKRESNRVVLLLCCGGPCVCFCRGRSYTLSLRARMRLCGMWRSG